MLRYVHSFWQPVKIVPWSQDVGALKEKGNSKGVALRFLFQNEKMYVTGSHSSD